MPPVTQQQIDTTGMSLRDMSIQNAQANQPSEGEQAASRIRQARVARNAGGERQGRTIVQPTVSATELTNAPDPVRVPEPEVPPVPVNPLGSAEQTLGNIRSQSETVERLRENEMAIGGLMEGESAVDMNSRMLQQFGVTDDVLKQRKEIGDQLASLIAASDLKKLDIASGGQSAAQGLRSLTQQDRETAIFAKQLEIQAANLDGQIQLGRQLAGDAVNLMLADRDFQYKNLIRQNQSLASQVDEETRQLLEAENRRYEEKLAEDERFKTDVDEAIASGVATNNEIASLTAPLPTHPDPATQEQLQTQAIQERMALAQSITARGASEMRDLSIEQARASIRSSNASAARAETGRLLDLAEAGDPGAIATLGLTMPDNTMPTADEIAYARQYAATGKVPSGMSTAGVSFGDIAELASDLPKAEGAIVDINTNVASDKLSATDQASFDALYNAINTDLPRIQAAWDEMNTETSFIDNTTAAAAGEQPEVSFGTGILGGIQSKVNPTQAMTNYETAVADFTAKLVLARSGAAATDAEVARYQALLPGTFNTPLGIGTPGQQKLTALQEQMKSALDDKLSTQGLAIYGYSDVETPQGTFKTGEIITNEYGQRGRVNPDGSITPYN